MTLAAENMTTPLQNLEKKRQFWLSIKAKLARWRIWPSVVWIAIAGWSGVGLLLIAIIAVYQQTHSVNTLSSAERQRTVIMLNALQDINQQLQRLHGNAQNSPAFQAALTQISGDIMQVHNGLNDLAKAAAVKQVSQQITSLQSDVDSQMLDIKREVANGSGVKQYLDAKVLPFQVISIDVMDNQPFVSINYDNHQTPLAIGDALGGWTLVQADYQANIAEFENSQQQYVKVMLQG